MTPLLPLLIALTARAEPPVCEQEDSSAEEDATGVLDAFRGTLDGHLPDELPARDDVAHTDTAVEVDEAWQGRVVPELRSTPAGAVTLRLGPPAVRDPDTQTLGWDVSYGCLVLEMDAGAVSHVAVHQVPCGLAIGE